MSVGIWQLVLILVIVFVLFGAGKLPNVMADVGKGIRNLKDAMNGKDVSEDTTVVKQVEAEKVETTTAAKKKSTSKKKNAA